MYCDILILSNAKRSFPHHPSRNVLVTHHHRDRPPFQRQQQSAVLLAQETRQKFAAINFASLYSRPEKFPLGVHRARAHCHAPLLTPGTCSTAPSWWRWRNTAWVSDFSWSNISDVSIVCSTYHMCDRFAKKELTHPKCPFLANLSDVFNGRHSQCLNL